MWSCALLLLSWSGVACQSVRFHRTYDFTSYFGVAWLEELTGGGYLLAGQFGAYDQSSAALLRTDAFGEPIELETFDVGLTDYLSDAVRAHDGGHLLLGRTGHTIFTEPFYIPDFDPNAPYFPFLIKTSPNGTAEWEVHYPDAETGDLYNRDDLLHVVTTHDGGYLLAGNHRLPDVVHRVLVKVDADGEVVWRQDYDEAAGRYAFVHDLRALPEGGYLLAGSEKVDFHYEMRLLRVGDTGEPLWETALPPPPSADVLYVGNIATVILEDEGAITFWNKSCSPCPFALSRTDATGSLIWEREYDSPNGLIPKWIEELPDGGYVMAGTAQATVVDPHVSWLVHLDRDGRVFWASALEHPSDHTQVARQTLDGGFALTGVSAAHWELTKTDAFGRVGDSSAP